MSARNGTLVTWREHRIVGHVAFCALLCAMVASILVVATKWQAAAAQKALESRIADLEQRVRELRDYQVGEGAAFNDETNLTIEGLIDAIGEHEERIADLEAHSIAIEEPEAAK